MIKSIRSAAGLAVLLGLLAPSARAQDFSYAGTFDVLTYNVAGLPAFLSSGNPEENTVLISPLLNGYDIVNVQEDFAYHGDLLSAATHPHVSPHAGNVPSGDGLNRLSQVPFEDLTRITWDDRHGVFDDGSDELTPKGFSYARHVLQGGGFVDVYNLHADAGTDGDSMAARRSNMRQLSDYILRNSEGNPVVVMGDTNNRYTRVGDITEELLEATGLEDVWIELVRGGVVPPDGPALTDPTDPDGPEFEVVDKILYRSGVAVRLSALVYQLEDEIFVDAQGDPLSDHLPATAAFDYEVDGDLEVSASVGGSGGVGFNNLAQFEPGARITLVELASGERVDGLGVVYSHGTTSRRGGTSAGVQHLVLEAGEYLSSAFVCADSRILHLQLGTNLGQSISGGAVSGSCTTFAAPAGQEIAAFYGRAGDELDQLGVVFADHPAGPVPVDFELAPAIGGAGGDSFNDLFGTGEGSRLLLLELQSGERVDGFASVYSDGTTLAHGGTSTAQVLLLGEAGVDEYLVSATACESGGRIHFLHLESNLGQTISGGTQTGSCTTWEPPAGWEIHGFTGRAGIELDQIGAIYRPHVPDPDPSIQLSGWVGGEGGTAFNDIAGLVEGAKVEFVELYSGARVDGLRTYYSNATSIGHGGTAGAQYLDLGVGEVLTSATVCTGSHSGSERVFFLELATNLGRSVAGGSTTGACTSWSPPPGMHIAGFYGRAGGELDKLGVIYLRDAPDAFDVTDEISELRGDQGKCLDDASGTAELGANVHLWECNQGENQKWLIDDQGLIHSAIDFDRCIDVFDFDASNGGNVVLWDCFGNPNQVWLWDGASLRTALDPGQVIDVAGAGTADGTNIQMWQHNGGANQRWSFVAQPVPEPGRVLGLGVGALALYGAERRRVRSRLGDSGR